MQLETILNWSHRFKLFVLGMVFFDEDSATIEAALIWLKGAKAIGCGGEQYDAFKGGSRIRIRSGVGIWRVIVALHAPPSARPATLQASARDQPFAVENRIKPGPEPPLPPSMGDARLRRCRPLARVRSCGRCVSISQQRPGLRASANCQRQVLTTHGLIAAASLGEGSYAEGVAAGDQTDGVLLLVAHGLDVLHDEEVGCV